MNMINALRKLGFTPIEATVFVTLCEHGSLTGYEVAKLTGISRSNVYAALHSLQEKGKCEVSEGENTKYIALSKKELILSTKREMQKTLEELEANYPKPMINSEPYITVKGYDNVLNKLKNCISLCQSHLYFLAPTPIIELLEAELTKASTHCRISIICEKHLELSHIKVYQREKKPTGFHMIIDTSLVLTGDLLCENAQCLYSKNDTLVRLMRESFVTELDMIALKKTQ